MTPDATSLLRAALALIFSVEIVLPLPDSRPYLAVIEKVAGKVGFFTEDGKLLREVKIGSLPHEAVLARDGRLYVSDNSRAFPGTGTFLSVGPGELKTLALEGNVWAGARKPTEESARDYRLTPELPTEKERSSPAK